MSPSTTVVGSPRPSALMTRRLEGRTRSIQCQPQSEIEAPSTNSDEPAPLIVKDTRPMRRYSWPEGHWDWPIKVTHKHGLRCGDLIFVGGQVDLDSAGTVLHPGDRATQIQAVISHIDTVLYDLGASLAHLVKLQVFYVLKPHITEMAIRDLIGAALPPASQMAI